MSHPFCGTGAACEGGQHTIFPDVGWDSWNGKAIYIRTTIDDSVTNKQAVGEAIRRWNELVGVRFLLVPDKGDVQIRLFEKHSYEWPFNRPEWFRSGRPVAGFAFNYDKNGTFLGGNPGLIARSDIYIRSDQFRLEYRQWVNYYAHEIGHAFGLADHPEDDINSVMSYQPQGRWLLGPSFEDVQSIANIYGLKNLTVKPSDLDGIENVSVLWHRDRYGQTRYSHLDWRKWKFWISAVVNHANPQRDVIVHLELYETYWVKAKKEGLLGFGRFELVVIPGKVHRWVYM